MAGEKDPREAFICYLAVERRYSAHTVRAYSSDLECLGSFLASRFHLDAASCWYEVTEQQLRAFLRGQLDESSRTTVSRRLATIRSFFSFLRKRGWRSENPADLLVAPRRGQHLPAYLEIDEVTSLLEAIPVDTVAGKRDRAIMELLYASGMRVAELTALDVSQVNFQARVVRVVGPSAVATTRRWSRSSNGSSSTSRKRASAWLTAGWLRCRRSAARVKLPQSTTATKLRNNTGSNIHITIVFATDCHGYI